MKSKLTWMILGMTFLGAVLGVILGEDAKMFEPVGMLFLRVIKMMIVPLVVCSIITGAASLAKSRSAGKTAGVTIGYYLMTTVIAVVIGVLLGLIFKPGEGLQVSHFDHAQKFAVDTNQQDSGFWGVVNSFVPENIVKSLSSGHVLQILFFGLLFGLATGVLPENKRNVIISFFDACCDALIWMMMKLMFFAPLGVFALMATAVGTFGWKMLENLIFLVGLYICGLLFHMFVTYGGMVKFFSNISPVLFFKRITKSQVFAFSSASSMATLPLNMEVCENDLEISNSTTSFVLPIGATINMDGNSMYYGLAAVFLAQVSGIDLDFHHVAMIVITSVTGSIGQAGVPGPSLLLLSVLLAAGIPLEGIGILLGVDRIFDMLRTAVNVTGDASCAAVVEKVSNPKK